MALPLAEPPDRAQRPERPMAVLMGDIVRSRRFGAHATLNAVFNAAVETANDDFAGDLASPLTITLGDEFQGLAFSLERAFRIVHRLRLDLLANAVEARFLVGTARIETAINRERAWNMMGFGLAEARAKLNDKSEDNRYRFSLPDELRTERLLDAAGLVLTHLESAWTPTQREYVLTVLRRGDRTKKAIAGDLGIQETSLYKVLRAAEYDLYSKEIDVIAGTLDDLDREVQAP